ncbi:MAG: SDR family oxidoreductase [Bacteroidetes bacterium]|nr:SDR family oxidoreductase [Bacteroidota bacterium]
MENENTFTRSNRENGKISAKKALEKGHQVNCLARNSQRIDEEEGLTIIEGNPNKEADLQKAINNCEAVISVLNISRKSDFPWSGLRTSKNYLSDVMSLLIPLAENQNLKRLSVCSAWGVAETKKDIPGWFRWFIDNSNIGIAYQDHERQEKIISESKLNWVIIRPVGLTNSKRQEKIKETFDKKPKPSLLISRESVAEYLVNSLENDGLIHKKVVISKE